jgi:hypothetical protein
VGLSAHICGLRFDLRSEKHRDLFLFWMAPARQVGIGLAGTRMPDQLRSPVIGSVAWRSAPEALAFSDPLQPPHLV